MQRIALGGVDVWGHVVELTDGLRVRFDLDDWRRLNVGAGQRLPVRVPQRDAARLFVADVTELPAVVWVTLARRVRAAG